MSHKINSAGSSFWGGEGRNCVSIGAYFHKGAKLLGAACGHGRGRLPLLLLLLWVWVDLEGRQAWEEATWEWIVACMTCTCLCCVSAVHCRNAKDGSEGRQASWVQSAWHWVACATCRCKGSPVMVHRVSGWICNMHDALCGWSFCHSGCCLSWVGKPNVVCVGYAPQRWLHGAEC